MDNFIRLIKRIFYKYLVKKSTVLVQNNLFLFNKYRKNSSLLKFITLKSKHNEIHQLLNSKL